MPASRSPTLPATAITMPRGWWRRASAGFRGFASTSASTRRWAAAWAARSTPSSSPPPSRIEEAAMTDATTRIDEIVRSKDVVLFMKGTALFPQCGFSSRAVAILDHLGVSFETVDVLQDPEIRQGIKSYSDWPTIPQLYVKGEFVGGSDIMMEMFEAGELQQLLDERQIART